MQGLWKEKVSGYDSKGIKRKKQTRRNSFNDKARGLVKKALRNKIKHNYSTYTLWSDTEYIESFYGIKLDSPEYSKVHGSHFKNVRKEAQKLAHHTDRMIFRNWKALCEWNTEVPTHSLSKSIANYIS